MTTQRRVQIAGILVLIGLFIETVTLFWTHPIAFIVFVASGLVFLVAGIGFYLWSLLGHGQ
ncbi:MAG: hypothetical protein HY710_07200 [Candidatus Latescibacteria bacterium]|nr:hypothetical protein [Candidatus Latescibacterota bacterium]